MSADFQKQVVFKVCQGGGVIKQRIARPNEGKSGGFRSIILYRQGEKAFFVFGFPKKKQRQHKNRRGTMVQKDGEKYVCTF